MTLRKLTENTIGGSNPSWTTRSTIFIAGWWRSSLRAIQTLSVNILTPRPRSIASALSHGLFARIRPRILARFIFPALWPLLVSFALLAATPLDLPRADRSQKRKRSNKPATEPCRTGCTPNTSAPEITAATPEDEAAQRELSSLARALHNADSRCLRQAGRVRWQKCRQRLGCSRRTRARLRRLQQKPFAASTGLARKSEKRLAPRRLRSVLDRANATRVETKRAGVCRIADVQTRISEHWNQGTIPRGLRAVGDGSRQAAGRDRGSGSVFRHDRKARVTVAARAGVQIRTPIRPRRERLSSSSTTRIRSPTKAKPLPSACSK